MADVFLMPPSTAELARENAPPRCSPYDKVKVLLSGWECDEKNHRGKNLDKMGALLKFWGYDVTRIFGDSTDGKAPRRHETGAYPTPVARAGSAASPCAVTDGFKKRLEGDFVPPAGPQEKRRTLLIVCYFGHGTKKRPGLKNGKKWLYGASDGRYVSISYLQEYARDEVGATDILFIPETCYGGWDGLPIATSTGCKDYTLCETLAAGDGDLTICSDIDWDTYSSRIIGTLSRNARYGLRVQELHELIHDPTITEAPGFYRSDGIQNDGGEVRSILLAPMRGSPAARRIAGYKVPSPRQLRSIPDTPMLGRHLTKEERAFLATWSIEQKRVLERLIREKKEESPTLRAARLNGVFMRAAIFQPFTSQEQPYAMKSAEDCARAEKILSRG